MSELISKHKNHQKVYNISALYSSLISHPQRAGVGLEVVPVPRHHTTWIWKGQFNILGFDM
jgi:hypothetical protein